MSFRTIRIVAFLVIITLISLSITQTAAAHGVEKHQGATPTSTIDNIIYQMLIMAAIVGIFVYTVLFAALWMFRKKSKRKRNFKFTEHRRLEIAWTIAPAILVAYLAYISGQALVVIDEAPAEGIDIEVIGHQWLWEFRYPDGNTTINELYIQEHQTVILDVTSADVIHAFSIPEFNIKMDALPDETNTIWFVAEPAGEYNILCAEFCGNEHHAMLGKLVIYPAEDGQKGYGPPDGFGSSVPPPKGDGRVIDVELWESGGTQAGRPWSIFPEEIEVAEGESVALRVWNRGDGEHNFTIGWPYNLEIKDIPVDEYRWLNFTADRATPSTAVWCAVPGHLDLGMEGFLIVGEPLDIDIDEHDEPDRQFQVLVFVGVFALFFIVVIFAARPGRKPDDDEPADEDEADGSPDDDESAVGEEEPSEEAEEEVEKEEEKDGE